jgi:hypothetical protein
MAIAVKVIEAGMDSKAVLARFEAARQALAMMAAGSPCAIAPRIRLTSVIAI